MTEQVPAYRVESWQDTMVPNEQGHQVPGKRVNVLMANGQRFYVEVPYQPGWAESAQSAIEDQHAEHTVIADHQGPMVQRPQRGLQRP